MPNLDYHETANERVPGTGTQAPQYFIGHTSIGISTHPRQAPPSLANDLRTLEWPEAEVLEALLVS